MQINDPSSNRRKSYMNIGEVFFGTATINGWKHLLAADVYKKIITDSLTNLSERGLAEVYAFVIMPNHIHLIWKTNMLNGRETVQELMVKGS